MTEPTLTRGALLQGAAAAGLAFAGPLKFATQALKGTLTVVQWNHVVPAYDAWFDKWAVGWGEQHDVKVTVDHVDYARLPALAAAEAKAKKGHDVFGFRMPPAAFEPYVIDHAAIVSEIVGAVGPYSDVARRSTYNPRTKKFFGVAQSITPAAAIWRHDVWNELGESPATWEHVRSAAPRLQAAGMPLGVGLSPALESQVGLLGLMLCFGSSLQDAQNKPALGGPGLVDAVTLVADLFRSTPRQTLAWSDAANNAFLLSGSGSLIVNAVSAVQLADDLDLSFAQALWLWPPPAGPSARVGVPQAVGVNAIWSFAKNPDAAHRFLVDLALQSPDATAASRFLDLPAIPGSFPGLRQAAAQVKAPPPKGKYSILVTIAQRHTRSPGFPGTANAAVAEAIDTGLVSRMFAAAAQGGASPAEAVAAASREARAIWAKWQRAGLV